jgi:hypothetical protein
LCSRSSMCGSPALFDGLSSVIAGFRFRSASEHEQLPPNNGTTALFNMKNDFCDSEVVRDLGKYGRIRQIRENRRRETQRFL